MIFFDGIEFYNKLFLCWKTRVMVVDIGSLTSTVVRIGDTTICANWRNDEFRIVAHQLLPKHQIYVFSYKECYGSFGIWRLTTCFYLAQCNKDDIPTSFETTKIGSILKDKKTTSGLYHWEQDERSSSFDACGSTSSKQKWPNREGHQLRGIVHEVPIQSMYGIFTYITASFYGSLCGSMLVNIP